MLKHAAAIDIDGCLANFCQVWCDAANEVLGTELSGVASAWDMESYGLTTEQVKAVWNSEAINRHWAKAQPFAEAREFLSFIPDGSLYITARGNNLKHDNAVYLRQMTIAWLLEHGFPELPIVYSSDKLNVAELYDLWEALEDQPDQVLEYANAGLKVFMPVYPYNEHVSHPNVVRLEGWK